MIQVAIPPRAGILVRWMKTREVKEGVLVPVDMWDQFPPLQVLPGVPIRIEVEGRIGAIVSCEGFRFPLSFTVEE